MIRLHRPVCPRPDRLAVGDYKHVENKSALIAASSGKCMYCEAFVRDTSFGDVEHIKPKGRYPTLEFDWDNLGFVCQRCNNAKGDKFTDAMPYVNPYTEDPESFLLASGAYLFQRGGSERGEITVVDITLNRPELLERRQELLDRIQKAIDNCYRTNEPLRSSLLAQLKEEEAPEKEFSFVVRGRLALEGI